MSLSNNLNEQPPANADTEETEDFENYLPYTSMNLTLRDINGYPSTLSQFKEAEKSIVEFKELKSQGKQLKKFRSLKHTFPTTPGTWPFHLVLKQYTMSSPFTSMPLNVQNRNNAQ